MEIRNKDDCKIPTTLIGRLNHFLKSVNESDKSFHEKTGLAKAFLRARDGGIVTSNLVTILRVYPELNPEWLLLGVGYMKRLHFDLAHIKIRKKGKESIAEIPLEQLLENQQELAKTLYLTLMQVQTQLFEQKELVDRQNRTIELLEQRISADKLI